LIALGVVKSLPATCATASCPALAAVRSEDKFNGRPSGKKTAAASGNVMVSSSPHCSGSRPTMRFVRVKSAEQQVS
jgi:hypothetical protein